MSDREVLYRHYRSHGFTAIEALRSARASWLCPRQVFYRTVRFEYECPTPGRSEAP